jgi:3-hydroxyisobutyrate dehydrogenase
VVVWDLNKKAVDDFVQLGASTTATAAELARECELIILCLPRSSDVKQVIFGSAGLAEGLSAGKVIVDQTSGIPSETSEFAQELAKLGVGMIDAPVAGGVPSALAGTITIMVSGTEDAWEKASPALKAISPKVYRCGTRVGDAQAIKLVNNTINAGYRMATLELVALGRKVGLSLPVMTDALTNGWGRNYTAKQLLTSLIQRKPSTNFALSLMVKDLNQALALGLECGAPMPIASVARGLMQIGLNTIGPDASLDDAVPLIESMAGVQLLQAPAEETSAMPTVASDERKTTIGLIGAQVLGESLLTELAKRHQLILLNAQDNRIAQLAPGQPNSPSVVLDFTKRSPTECRSLAANLASRGVAVLDVAMAGTNGRLDEPNAVLCGGSVEAFAMAQPVLTSMNTKAIYCGEAGNGQLAKLVVNAVAACNRAVIYENAAMGLKYGLNTDEMARIVNDGSGWSGESERILPRLTSGRETTKVTMGEMLEDLTALTRLGFENGLPLLVVSEVRTILEAQVIVSGADASLDALKTHYESAAGIHFKQQ